MLSSTSFKNTMARSCNAVIALCSALAVSATLMTATHAASPQSRIKPPPSADLLYSITAKQSGLTVKGDATLHWSVSGNRYVTSAETNAMMFGRILDTRSEGVIEPSRLAPTRYAEKRYRKRESSITFDRSGNTATYSESQQTYALRGGEQDRASVIWQLISVARAAPGKFKPDSEWTFAVAGRRDIDPWTFKVVRMETVQTALGSVQAVHIQKLPSSAHRDQEVDLWLAPSLEWYPVQLRMSERDGAQIEQKLQKITH